MISRTHRFHGYASLRHAYRGGQASRGALFSVKAALNPRRKSYRVAVVVSRKVHKSAVARNRMRRRLYEVVRANQELIGQPFDIVITVFNGGVLEEDHKQLAGQLKKQFKELGIITK